MEKNKSTERVEITQKAAKQSSVVTIVKKRLAHLMSVKSLVTLMLTVVFGILALTESISQDFMTIYAIIIAFYFGTQSQKLREETDNGESE